VIWEVGKAGISKASHKLYQKSQGKPCTFTKLASLSQ
jgi:hypothetical protein